MKIIKFTFLVLFAFVLFVPSAQAQGDSPAAIYVRLLKGGRLKTDEQISRIVSLVCQNGNEEDLAYVFEQIVSPKGYKGKLQQQALAGLVDAAANRNTQPKADLEQLIKLLERKTLAPQSRLNVIQLAGLWKLKNAGKELQQIVFDSRSTDRVRSAALESLVDIGDEVSGQTIAKLLSKDQPLSLRYLGASALIKTNLESAIPKVVEILQQSDGKTDPAVLIDAILAQKGGSEQLAKALEKVKIPADSAKLMLRSLYAVGRSDPQLAAVLGKVAGLNAQVKPLSKEELQQLAQKILKTGNPERGELIFRRTDLSCMKCHAVSKAGGQIGPDLSAVGTNSPVDYLINSIMVPELAVKEEYVTTTIYTKRSRIHQGIVVDKDDEKIILKDANGKQVTVQTKSIELKKEGGSLMPKGLVNFLTRAELIDLVSFLSHLGKPETPYAVRSTPTIQRWRYLNPVTDEQVTSVPDVQSLTSSQWNPAYAKVNGELPLNEILQEVKKPVLYLYGEVEVTSAGELGVKLGSTDGVQVWMEDKSIDPAQGKTVELSEGKHRVLFRVDTRKRKATTLRAVLVKPENSEIEFTVVDGS